MVWGLNKVDEKAKAIRIKKLPPAIALRFLFFDPLQNKNCALPAGLPVQLFHGDQLLDIQKTNAKGIVAFYDISVGQQSEFSKIFKQKKPGLYFAIDFQDLEFIDLDKQAYVPDTDVKFGIRKKLISLPSDWCSRDQNSFLDDRGGKFKNGEISKPKRGDFGTLDAPWQIAIDHGWKKYHLNFKYYDIRAKKESGFSGGTIVKAFLDVTGPDRQAAASTMLDPSGLYYFAISPKDNVPSKLYWEMQAAPEHFLRIDDGTVVQMNKSDYKKLTLPKQHAHYAIPELWRSTKQRARLKNKEGSIESFLKEKNLSTSKEDPLLFSLDDFVLCESRGDPIVWKKDQLEKLQFAIFDRRMSLREPQGWEPYLTTDDRADKHHNVFAAEKFYFRTGHSSGECTRVIRVKDSFFDLEDKRTSKDPIGARAAVYGDHPQQQVTAPLLDRIGLYDLHYFHDCYWYKNEKSKPLAHLLVYWCGKFVPTPLSYVENGVNKVHVVDVAKYLDFKKTGTVETKKRHEGKHPAFEGQHKDAPQRPNGSKDYLLRRHNRSKIDDKHPDRIIKVCFHLAASDTPPFHHKVELVGGPGRDHVNLLTPEEKKPWFMRWANIKDKDGKATGGAQFGETNYQPKGQPVQDRSDNLQCKSFVMAHEMGHIVGLGDNYIEPYLYVDPADNKSHQDWGDPLLPGFHQSHWYILPYSLDYISLMYANLALRMRHYWQYANWLNKHSAVKELLGNEEYQVEYQVNAGNAAGKTLKYYLPKEHSNFTEPAFKKKDHVNGRTGRMDLLLYKVGQDETTYCTAQRQTWGFDSILVVRINIFFEFTANHAGTKFSAWNDVENHLRDFQDKVDCFVGRLGQQTEFALERKVKGSGKGEHFDKCFVLFLPHYDVGNSAPARTHVHVQYRPAGGVAVPGIDLSDIDSYTKEYIATLRTQVGPKVKVCENTDKVALFRYMLGLPAAAFAGAGPTFPIQWIDPADLKFLATWVGKATGGGTYEVKQYQLP